MSRTSSRLPVAAVAIAAATAIAACGSNSHSSASVLRSSGQPTQAEMRQGAVRFAGCMRSHGVPNLPDPTTSPHEFKFSLSPNSANARSPAFQSAETACQHLLPNGGRPSRHEAPHTQAQIAALVAFAHCLRNHGFRNFPDPTSSGQVTHEMLANAGINLHQPAVAPTADACTSVTHGVITKATVARFVAGQ